MTYTVTYRNNGTDAATGVQLTDTLPASVTYVFNSCTATCIYNAGSSTLTWNLGTIAAGSALVTKTYQVTVSPTAANNSTLTNNAQILSAENDANVANNSASVTTTVFTPAISGTVIDDANGNGAVDAGELGLADATISLFRDGNGNGVLDPPATDPAVGSAVVTPASGEWAFTSGLVKNARYFVVRSNPAGYTSTNAIPESVVVGTDHSTATKDTNDRLNVAFDNVGSVSQYSSNNYFLAKVSKQNQAITFAQLTTPAAYGTRFNVNPTASSGLSVTLVASGGCTATSATTGWDVTMTSSTTDCVLTASQAGNTDYNAASNVQRTVSASKAVLNVDAVAKSKTYGDSDPALTATYSGFVNGDTAGTVTVSGAASCSRTAGESAGVDTNGITCAPGNLAAANYTFVTGAKADFTIAKRAVTVTADPKTKVYGSADPGSTYSVTSGSLKSGDSFNGVLGRAAGESVGSYAIQQGTLSAGSNYDLTFVGASLSVTKAVLNVNAVAKTKVYGASDPSFTWTYSGFVNGDTASGTTVTGDAACSRESGRSAGTYVITCAPGTLASANYSLSTGTTANLSITQAVLNVDAVAKTKTYGDIDPALTGLPRVWLTPDL